MLKDVKTQKTEGVVNGKGGKNMENLLSATEVCVLLDCSIYSLNTWYEFKRKYPDNEYAKILPDFVNKDAGKRRKRYWRQSDIGKLVEFKNTIPHGRNGVLGAVTQKYSKYSRRKNNGETEHSE